MKKSFLSRNIKKLRHFKNLNQQEFADLFKLSRPALASYEEGRSEPKLAVLFEISTHFEISMNDLFSKELTVNDIARFDDQQLFDEKSIYDLLNNMNTKIDQLEDTMRNLSSKSNSKK